MYDTTIYLASKRGISSVGRASRLQRDCHWFEPGIPQKFVLVTQLDRVSDFESES